MTPAQIAALAKPPPPAAAPAAGDAAAAGSVRIQLASLRSPDEARDEWARLKRENGDLLGKLTAVAVRADMGDKGIYYRIEVGPLASKSVAAHLCDALRERDLGCQLVR
jgi:cell division septation protein DedD